MVHFKNRIGIDDIIPKRGKIGMVDYKNRIGVDDIITKRGKSGMVDYVFLEGQNRNHRLYFCFYKNGFNSPTVTK